MPEAVHLCGRHGNDVIHMRTKFKRKVPEDTNMYCFVSDVSD